MDDRSVGNVRCWNHGGNHADDSIGSDWDPRDNQPSQIAFTAALVDELEVITDVVDLAAFG